LLCGAVARSARNTPWASSKNTETGPNDSAQILSAKLDALSTASCSFRAVRAYSCGRAESSVIISRKSICELDCLNHSMVQMPPFDASERILFVRKRAGFCWRAGPLRRHHRCGPESRPFPQHRRGKTEGGAFSEAVELLRDVHWARVAAEFCKPVHPGDTSGTLRTRSPSVRRPLSSWANKLVR